MFTGLIASTYAPDLDLTGVAAAAPATELATLFGDDINSSGGRNLTAMTLWSWSRVFDAPIDRVVYPKALPTVDRLAGECIESIYDLILRSRTSAPLAQTFLSVSNFYTAEPWRSPMASNTSGPLPAKVPLLLAQGGADELVRPQVTQDYMKRQCQVGGKVKMLFLPNANHGVIARDAAPSVIDWITDRLAGFPPPNDCNRG
ncbi:MAG: lipase family protein [Xanthobacteraceae bacterium]